MRLLAVLLVVALAGCSKPAAPGPTLSPTPSASIAPPPAEQDAPVTGNVSLAITVSSAHPAQIRAAARNDGDTDVEMAPLGGQCLGSIRLVAVSPDGVEWPLADEGACPRGPQRVTLPAHDVTSAEASFDGRLVNGTASDRAESGAWTIRAALDVGASLHAHATLAWNASWNA